MRRPQKARAGASVRFGWRASSVMALGAIGVGLVWGWLAAAAQRSLPLHLANGVAIAGASLLVATETAALVGWRGAPTFLAAAASAIVLQLGWRRYLSRRANRPAMRAEAG